MGCVVWDRIGLGLYIQVSLSVVPRPATPLFVLFISEQQANFRFVFSSTQNLQINWAHN